MTTNKINLFQTQWCFILQFTNKFYHMHTCIESEVLNTEGGFHMPPDTH